MCESVCTSDKLISQRIQGIKHVARTRLKSVFRVYIYFISPFYGDRETAAAAEMCVENSIFYFFAFHFHVCIGWKTSYDCMPSRSTVGGATIVPNVCLRCEERRNVNETKYIIHVRSNETSLDRAWAGFSSIWAQHRVEQWTIYDDNIDSLFFLNTQQFSSVRRELKEMGMFFWLLCNRENLPSGCGFSGAQPSDEFTHVREMIIFVYYILTLPISHDVSLLTAVRMHTMLQQPSCWIKSECELQSAGNFFMQ